MIFQFILSESDKILEQFTRIENVLHVQNKGRHNLYKINTSALFKQPQLQYCYKYQ